MPAPVLPDIEALDGLPTDAVAAWLAAAQARFAARVLAAAAAIPLTSASDRLLDAREVAKRTDLSADWWYRHGKRLPFARKVGRSLRFSEQGLNRWIATRRP